MPRNRARVAAALRRVARKDGKLTGKQVEQLYAAERPATFVGLSPLERRIQTRKVQPPPRGR